MNSSYIQKRHKRKRNTEGIEKWFHDEWERKMLICFCSKTDKNNLKDNFNANNEKKGEIILDFARTFEYRMPNNIKIIFFRS